jgi:hypothetical protein
MIFGGGSFLFHHSYRPGDVPSSSPLRRGAELIYKVSMYNPNHSEIADRESTQIQVLWDVMPMHLLHKNHAQITFLPEISNPALYNKCQNQNTKSMFFFFFFFAVSRFSFAGSHHPCEASYQNRVGNHATYE